MKLSSVILGAGFSWALSVKLSDAISDNCAKTDGKTHDLM